MMYWILLVLASFKLQTAWSQDFGYEGSIGPNHWGEKYRKCIGKHQSPINIVENEVKTIELPPLKFEHFDVIPEKALLKNNGHTVVLTMTQRAEIPTISGGPLVDKFKFAQLHFHWGSHDAEGSENTINNNSFPMELHAVFYQKRYGSFERALEHPDGVAVLSFLFHKSNKHNKHYDTIIELLPLVEFYNSKVTVNKMPTFDALTLSNRSVYFTYGGSLTTPPCSEVVTWIEFKNTIPMTHYQFAAFRRLKNDIGTSMIRNFRPTQPINDRLIRMVDETKHNSLFLVKEAELLESKLSGAISLTRSINLLIYVLLGMYLWLFT